jgi:hypothetical protein
MSTLEEFKDTKFRLELDILELLRKFQDEYKVSINRVDVNTDVFIGERINRVVSCNIKVEI